MTPNKRLGKRKEIVIALIFAIVISVLAYQKFFDPTFGPYVYKGAFNKAIKKYFQDATNGTKVLNINGKLVIYTNATPTIIIKRK